VALNEPINIHEHLKPILGMRPWRARLGWGSFLSFDFGEKVRRDNHLFGAWRLWIQYCDWQLAKGERIIVDSESARHLMQNAVRNLEKYPLSDVETQPDSDKTVFLFGTDLRLVCTPYSDQDPDEDIWTLFSPGSVLNVGINHRFELQHPRVNASV
jgi:hypothetical protein